ncbi:MAG: GntR family transcriptional regulator [Lachnospiraceae bacterium]|nr:GntR family transcriptional regulator [Lachnospiraceae bacterium]
MEQSHELLADEIAQKILEQIQDHTFKAGERLTVRKLCERYGTSETPVKQALNQLVSTGLVVSVPKCGMRVRTFEFQDMKNIWEARIMIEQYCASYAVEEAKRNEDFVRRMQDMLQVSNEEYEKCALEYTRENFRGLHKHDRMLHLELVKCSQNAQIIKMYDELNAHAGMFSGFRCHSPETLRQVEKQHTEIVKSLVLCDTDGLRQALSRHIYSTIQIYRSAWDN